MNLRTEHPDIYIPLDHSRDDFHDTRDDFKIELKHSNIVKRKQKSTSNSRTGMRADVTKHPWLLNGSKYNKMRDTEKQWEK